MPQIALTTFLKLYSMNRLQKEREYKKYLKPGGGYDFYWTLKKSATAMTVGGKTYDESAKIFKSISNAAEIKNNKEGLTSLDEWLGDAELKFFNPPHGAIKSPKEFLTIKLKPEFGFESSQGRRLVTIWNTKVPEITQRMAAAGIYLMDSQLRKGQFEDCACTVLNLRKKFLYITDRISDETKMSVTAELNWVDQFFEEHASEKAA